MNICTANHKTTKRNIIKASILVYNQYIFVLQIMYGIWYEGHVQAIGLLRKITELMNGHVKLYGALSSLLQGGLNKNSDEIAANKLPFLKNILTGTEGTETYVHKISEYLKYQLLW